MKTKTPVTTSFFFALIVLFSALTARAEVELASDVRASDAYNDALSVAAMNANWTAIPADGTSMLPYYDSKSILMIDRASFNQLRAGMMVVYRDNDGDLVGHQLIRKTENGWVARGINNRGEDPELVTAANYRGVVFGVFHSNGVDAEKLAGKERVIGKSF
ncbi:S24/S26 family peptidase [Ruficoccus sp. ZRK36]|uniref:S24/S26 family peptidase n=1 Tax=Ruficoccus sp. ZRK36 TaxID=2866311 RepID=UPI001C73C6DC|nr:S24/S26 family peptidase [Ruficoccus sp. ZRK36]QYY37023.1 S24/S26 family peptidase [Ruficoccus sp. ZRK36]